MAQTQTTDSDGISNTLGLLAEVSGNGSNAVGFLSDVSGDRSNAVGVAAMIKGNDSNALGPVALVSGDRSTAVGLATLVKGSDSNALGPMAVVTGNASNAVGFLSEVSGDGSNAVGFLSGVSGDRSTAVGVVARVKGSDSIALGSVADVSGDKSTAVGVAATVKGNNSIALGAGAEADATSVVTVDNVSINGITYGKFTGIGNENNGVVSFGAPGRERQVMNVAAGKISDNSTDAINGSQLFKTNTVLGDVASSTATILGADAKVDPTTGKLSMTDIGGTGRSTVHEAIADVRAKRSVVANGNGILVTPVTVNDKTTYTVALSDTVKAKEVSAGQVRVNESVAVIDGPSMSRDGIDAAGKPISNVAPGVKPGDVATVGQVNRAVARVGQVSRALNQINGKVDQYRKDAVGGTAAAMAMANLPQAYLPGKSMFAIGGSSFQGQRGYAAGLSTVSENGNWVVKGSVSGSGRGQFGGAVGVGYQW